MIELLKEEFNRLFFKRMDNLKKDSKELMSEYPEGSISRLDQGKERTSRFEDNLNKIAH